MTDDTASIAGSPMPELGQVLVGDALWARDVRGDWLPRIAVSQIERAGRDRLAGTSHDFAGVYVRHEDVDDGSGVFWPLEDLRFRS
jgi:hypothetical protein